MIFPATRAGKLSAESALKVRALTLLVDVFFAGVVWRSDFPEARQYAYIGYIGVFKIGPITHQETSQTGFH